MPGRGAARLNVGRRGRDERPLCSCHPREWEPEAVSAPLGWRPPVEGLVRTLRHVADRPRLDGDAQLLSVVPVRGACARAPSRELHLPLPRRRASSPPAKAACRQASTVEACTPRRRAIWSADTLPAIKSSTARCRSSTVRRPGRVLVSSSPRSSRSSFPAAAAAGLGSEAAGSCGGWAMAEPDPDPLTAGSVPGQRAPRLAASARARMWAGARSMGQRPRAPTPRGVPGHSPAGDGPQRVCDGDGLMA
jgi:hypothetical protein